jgi:hypothetical protein
VSGGTGRSPITEGHREREGIHVSRESTVFGWLRDGVPLSLLLDLALPEGPDSVAIARYEGGVTDAV